MKTDVLDIKIDNLSFKEAVEKAAGFLCGDKNCFIVTPNPEIVLRAKDDEIFKNVLNSASLSIPDGFGLLLVSRLTKNRLKERVSGADLFEALCFECSKNNKSIFLLGGQADVAKKTAEKLQRKFPNLKIAGWLDGDVDLENCWQVINDAKPDALFVALGAPKQEKWIYGNINKIKNLKLAMGVGGTFDFISGKAKRAPKFLRDAGFEWLWRLIIQPRRINRTFNAVVVFPAVFMYSKIGKHNKI